MDSPAPVEAVEEQKNKTNRRCRRKKKETFRPYYALTESERQEREDSEAARVERLMMEMKAKGRVIAPYNTTQFLISDHGDDVQMADSYSPDYSYSNEEEDEDFLCREFNKDYEQQHINHLWLMNKEKLMSEYLNVARKNEALEKKIDLFTEEEERLGEMEKEMLLLREQNRKLIRSNSTMKERIRKLSETSDGSSSYVSNNF